MKKHAPLSRLKAYSPVVKKRSLQRLQYDLNQQVQQHQQEVSELNDRSEAWASEVRALRLEVQRLKEYDKWLAMNFPTANDIAGQRHESQQFTYRPLISVIMPVYNTNPDYLKVCIDSVLAQSYVNWQLCIIDDASNNQATLNCLKSYVSDPRINIKRSAQNGHISVASNQAIEMAEGEFVALLDHDDYLWPNALYEVAKLLQDYRDADFIYSDEDKIEADGCIHFMPYFKPDWSPHLLECVNYITHFSVMRTSLVRAVGSFDKSMVGAQDWDLFLRLSEKTQKIYHIPTILYSWRAHERSTALSGNIKDYALMSQEEALRRHFVRTHQAMSKLKMKAIKGLWYARREQHGRPLISIIIPTKDKVDYLKRCIDSILTKSTYFNHEIIIVDTGSKEDATKAYYQTLKESLSTKRLHITHWRHQPFNYSAACNFGAKSAKGEYLVMLNNDTEVISESWLEDMLGYAQLKNVAAVGVKLLYPSMHIQHAGVAVGIGSHEPVAGHIGINTDYKNDDFLTRIYTDTVRDTTAVTAACLMVSAKKFWEVGGFDPIFRVTFNDVDLCLKFRKAGYNNIYLPYVELFHHESVSIGRVNQNRDMTELDKSAKLMRKRWPKVIDNDPYYNKNFYILSSNFGLDIYSKKSETST
jgi:glycosyltransferase involved in cell wall biosynthesis